MAHSFTRHVTVAPDVLFRFVGEEAVLLHLKTETYLGLDQIGTRMWDVLTRAPSIQAAYDALLDEFDVEPARLRQDMGEFLEELVGQGLIEVGSQ